VTPLPPSDALIAEQMQPCVQYPDGRTREETLAELAREEKLTTLWINHIYQVQRRELKNAGLAGDDVILVHLNIRRRDGGPILRDWRHFQWIKNQLIGDECEAIELYPAESRLTDTSNKFHLFGVLDPTYRFPIHMFDIRDVNYTKSGTTNGTRQRLL